MEGESGRKKECRGWFHVAVAVTFLTLAEAMVVFLEEGNRRRWPSAGRLELRNLCARDSICA